MSYALYMRPHDKRHGGFTLIELMVVVAIAAILASVALPMYRTYVMRGRIIDATSKLSDFRVRMEQYFMDNRTYASGANCGVADPTLTGDAAFDIKCTGASATNYTVKATGRSAAGMSGFEYQIVASGAKKTNAVPSGWTTASDCWVTKKDGSC
ncbi:MAG TPA: type IV pilin protein [Casimicrobiaceae bacterium]|nr:type IV pilin protein [Casimicrobiaceae bacterium]